LGLGTRIAQVRNGKGMTQIFVTRKLSRTSGWLSNIENGRRPINTEELSKIADVLGVDVRIFFEDDYNATFKLGSEPNPI